jgi:hypothetical protein
MPQLSKLRFRGFSTICQKITLWEKGKLLANGQESQKEMLSARDITAIVCAPPQAFVASKVVADAGQRAFRKAAEATA